MESKSIAKETRISAQQVHINFTQMTIAPSAQNIIWFIQLKTNDHNQIKRLLVVCFKCLAKIIAKIKLIARLYD